jgi:hypothetical protein
VVDFNNENGGGDVEDTLKYSVYYDRLIGLTQQSIAFAISFILVGHFMALNFDSNMGGIMTLFSICAIIV